MLTARKRKRDYKRAVKFGLVGVVNTALDFGIYNALTKFFFIAVIPANTISTTLAMFFSFLVNRKVVFKPEGGSAVRQVIAFYAVTAIGLYALQNGIIFILVHVWTVPLQAALHVIRSVGITQLSDGFYINNGAKAIGTAASLAWNYYLYKKVVFR